MDKPIYLTVKGMEDMLRGIALVTFSVKDQPEKEHSCTVFFPALVFEYTYTETLANIRERKQQTYARAGSLDFFDTHADILCRAAVLRGVFKIRGFMETYLSAKRCQQN